ncbi:uncharacterized protein LOC142333654 [Lycorma delicatula]|uniref:uncharacterized protein LOC142333654 n=1 Tax=Lycorma delicatula TaxID=130591 RepID=UPI003F511E33
MWRKQDLLMYFILTTMFVGSNGDCTEYINGIRKYNLYRESGYTDDQTIQSLVEMYCNKLGKNSRYGFHSTKCLYLTDKYFRLVGENEYNIKKFSDKCMERGFKQVECIKVMLSLERRCWDMRNATFLIQLVKDIKMLLYIESYPVLNVQYTQILWMKNFQPQNCMEAILKNDVIRDTIFDEFYYSWFENQKDAKGCECNEVIRIYNSTKSSEERVKLLERQCL